MINYKERYSRQSSLLPMQNLIDSRVSIIGVGAIGRNVAIQLASLGVEKIHLIDFDTVEESNVASQGFAETDIGKTKVEATASQCKNINSKIEVICEPARFKKNMPAAEAVFCCVDKIETRKFIYDAIKDRILFFVDGRMAAETLRVITFFNKVTKEYYESTLFKAEEAYSGSCTSKTTIYCANIASGFMVSQFAKWQRQYFIEKDVSLNLLDFDILIN